MHQLMLQKSGSIISIAVCHSVSFCNALTHSPCHLDNME